MRRPAACAAAVLAGSLVVAGCGSGSSGGAAPAPSTYTPSPCPSPAHRQTHWPKLMPKDMPKPPDAKILGAETASDGVRLVKFTTPSSLRDAVLFVVNRLPKAGYALGRGDAEATEADAPFVHGNSRGVVRMLVLTDCQTEWLVATATVTFGGGTSPLLPVHSPSGSPSPLPFG